MTIRSACDDDFAAVAAITNHYIATTAIHFGYEPVDAHALRDAWRAHPQYPWLVTEEAGRVQGYAKAGAWRERAAYAWTCEVGLYIIDDARGRGLGRAIYAALLEACARQGFRSAIAGITLPNAESVALHARLGFASTGIVRDAGFKLGRWHDVEFLQKRFTDDNAGPRELAQTRT
jgi:phosphinothricin acetyltransferase